MKSWMTRLSALLAIVALVLALAPQGFASDSTPELSIEDARAALAQMMATPEWKEFEFAKNIPKASEFRLEKDDQLAAGPWIVWLKAKTFSFAIINPPSVFYNSSGVFVKHEKDGWKAVVRKITRS